MWPALAAALDALFPPRCAACRALLPARDRPSAPLELCAACEPALEEVHAGCARCGMPLYEDAPGCAACEAEPPAFDGARSLYRYGGASADILHRYKYEDRPELARVLGARLAALALPAADLVIPVPLHPWRRIRRTYDQALYLAQALARHRGLPCRRDVLERARSTPRQVGRTREERTGNVRDAFRVRARLAGERVWLVDDVVTTGATASECARALKDGGARSVFVVSVARAG